MSVRYFGLILFFFCAVTILPMAVNAGVGVGYAQGERLITGTVWIDGVSVVNQVDMVIKNSGCYVPRQVLVEKIDTTINWDTNGDYWLHQGVVYLPAQLVTKKLGYPALWVPSAHTIAFFSQPLLPTDPAAEAAAAKLLEGYFNQNIYELPRDLEGIKAHYARYMHPDYLDGFATNLHAALTTPASWGATEYIDSILLAQTEHYAVAHCHMWLHDGSTSQKLTGLWGFKKHKNQWLMVW